MSSKYYKLYVENKKASMDVGPTADEMLARAKKASFEHPVYARILGEKATNFRDLSDRLDIIAEAALKRLSAQEYSDAFAELDAYQGQVHELSVQQAEAAARKEAKTLMRENGNGGKHSNGGGYSNGGSNARHRRNDDPRKKHGDDPHKRENRRPGRRGGLVQIEENAEQPLTLASADSSLADALAATPDVSLQKTRNKPTITRS